MPCPMPRRPAGPGPRGFTLIELLIAVTVALVLAAVAYPSYSGHIAKSRRGDGKQALVELAQKLERFYTERGTYAGATLGSSGIYPSSSQGGYYTLSITSQTADGFVISAAPTGAQTGDACGTLKYNQLGSASLGSDATATLAACW